jgi:hypothetical protein
MALLTGYHCNASERKRLIPGWVAIAFTRELGRSSRNHARSAQARRSRLSSARCTFRGVGAIESMGIGPLRFLVARACLRCFADAVLSTFQTSRPCSPAAWFAKHISASRFLFSRLVKDSLLIRDIITGILKELSFRSLSPRSPVTGA